MRHFRHACQPAARPLTSDELKECDAQCPDVDLLCVWWDLTRPDLAAHHGIHGRQSDHLTSGQRGRGTR